MGEVDALSRYDRQLRLEGWDQSRLLSGRVVIAGVGALGCEVAKNLSLMGVGELLLIDNDYVELSNLSRQMLYTDQDIGQPKASTAEKKISMMNPLVKVKGLQTDVRRIPEETFGEVDVIVSAVDNWPTRRWINSMAVHVGTALVDVATDGYYGNVQTVIPRVTSCLECHAEALIPADIQASECSLRRRTPNDLVKELSERGIVLEVSEAEALFKYNIKTVYDIKFAPQTVLDQMDKGLRDQVIQLRSLLNPKMPALQSISATVSGLAAFEVVRILHKGSLGRPLNGMMVFDGLKGRLTRIKLERNINCHVCGYDEDKPMQVNVSPDETVADLRERLSNLLMFPDTRLQHGAKLLSDDMEIESAGIVDGDILYIHSSRRATPVAVKVRLVEAGN
ncbi:MAG: ThiF family adenylyltransferase [Candidatus Caldarchaeum sp.]